MKRTIDVVAAVIRSGNRVLATQRGYGPDKDGWEFPGGKIEPGETPQAALRREIAEELAAQIEVGPLLAVVDHEYPGFFLHMLCYWAVLPAGGVQLLEHEAARWLGPEALESVDWLPADRQLIEPIRAALTRTAVS